MPEIGDIIDTDQGLQKVVAIEWDTLVTEPIKDLEEKRPETRKSLGNVGVVSASIS